MTICKFDIDKATKAECNAEAARWLDNGVRYESEGKPEKYIDMALNNAVKYENAAFDGRS